MTTGPWIAKPIVSDDNGHWSIESADITEGDFVAEAYSADDAHVIAAAPELLAVVRRVAAHFDGTDAPLGRAALAALAKAGG